MNDLYQQLILDHSKDPRNYGSLKTVTNTATGDNPLCGDKISVELAIQDNTIHAITFQGSGCAISMASASMMTEAVSEKSIEEAEKIAEAMNALLKGTTGTTQDSSDDTSTSNVIPEKLHVFAGVKNYPGRTKCATLAWHALLQALQTTSGNHTDSSVESQP